MSPREQELQEALRWVTATLESVLAGVPVRDADEVIGYAKTILKG